MTTLLDNAPALKNNANLSEHMQGFLIALESRQLLDFHTPATAPLTESLLRYIGEDALVEAAEAFEEDDDLMDGVNLVEPFYLKYFIDNLDGIKHYLGVTAETDEDHHPDTGYDYIYDLIDVQCFSSFDIEHVKVAFNSPKNTTEETLDDSDPYDDVYFFTAEFSSAVVARSICQAYTNYTQLALG